MNIQLSYPIFTTIPCVSVCVCVSFLGEAKLPKLPNAVKGFPSKPRCTSHVWQNPGGVEGRIQVRSR